MPAYTDQPVGRPRGPRSEPEMHGRYRGMLYNIHDHHKRIWHDCFFKSNLHETLSSSFLNVESDSEMSCSRKSLTPRCPAQGRVWLRNVLFKEESDSKMSCSRKSLTQRGLAQGSVLLRDVMLKEESDSEMSCSRKSLTQRCPAQGRVCLRDVLLKEESDSPVSFLPYDNAVCFLP